MNIKFIDNLKSSKANKYKRTLLQWFFISFIATGSQIIFNLFLSSYHNELTDKLQLLTIGIIFATNSSFLSSYLLENYQLKLPRNEEKPVGYFLIQLGCLFWNTLLFGIFILQSIDAYTNLFTPMFYLVHSGLILIIGIVTNTIIAAEKLDLENTPDIKQEETEAVEKLSSSSPNNYNGINISGGV